MGPKKKSGNSNDERISRIRAPRPTKAEERLKQQQGERENTPFVPQRCSCSIFGKGLEPHLIERSAVWQEHQNFLQREYTRNRPVGIPTQRKQGSGPAGAQERKHLLNDGDTDQSPSKRPRPYGRDVTPMQSSNRHTGSAIGEETGRYETGDRHDYVAAGGEPSCICYGLVGDVSGCCAVTNIYRSCPPK